MMDNSGSQPSDIRTAVEAHANTHLPGGADPLPAGIGPAYGDVKTSYGVLADLLLRNPGWKLADGTVTLPDGSTPPDMRDRVLIGAGTTYALGGTGGSATQADHAHHSHAYTNANFVVGGVATAVNPLVPISNESPTLTHGTNLPPYAALYMLIYVGTS